MPVLMIGVNEESPLPGQAWDWSWPMKPSPYGMFTGAVNHRSPSPATRMPNS